MMLTLLLSAIRLDALVLIDACTGTKALGLGGSFNRISSETIVMCKKRVMQAE